jgi:hypothetical protein
MDERDGNPGKRHVGERVSGERHSPQQHKRTSSGNLRWIICVGSLPCRPNPGRLHEVESFVAT